MTEVMAAEIEKLIERLKKLAGPDREADVLIAAAINWEGPLVHRPVSQFIKDMGGVSAVVKSFDSGGLNAFRYIPEYTKSMDAALTLVPEGGGCVGVWKIIKGSSGCVGEIDLGQWKGWHETSPAIALCIASLKAIAALRALSHKGSSNG